MADALHAQGSAALPASVAALVKEPARYPRERATMAITRLLRAICERDTPRGGEIVGVWLYGSYARGAMSVGDIDAHVRVCDERPYLGRGAAMEADSCLRGSLPLRGAPPASLVIERVWATDEARGIHAPPRGSETRAYSQIWARGDSFDRSLERLDAITPDPEARRHPRSSGVAYLDALAPVLKSLVLPGFDQAPGPLAQRVLAGEVTVAAHALTVPNEQLEIIRRAVSDKYAPGGRRYREEVARAAVISAFPDDGLRGLFTIRPQHLVDGCGHLWDRVVWAVPSRSCPFLAIEAKAVRNG